MSPIFVPHPTRDRNSRLVDRRESYELQARSSRCIAWRKFANGKWLLLAVVLSFKDGEAL